MIQKKVCMIGAYGVGKTSLVRRFVESLFDERYHTTVGVRIDKKRLTVSGRDIILMLWDMAGEDELIEVKMSHLRGASGYLLVVDGCRKATLEVACDLRERVSHAHGPLPFVVVINKSDLRRDWGVSGEAIEGMRGRGWTVIETSALTGAGVEEAFHTLAAVVLREDDDERSGGN